jgi:hypothetical protein
MSLYGIRDEHIPEVLTEPSLIWRVIAPDEEQSEAPPKSGFLQKLFKSKKPEPRKELPDLSTGLETDLDKAWHGIHYLLTGTESAGNPPLNFLLCGGAEVGDIEVGYGPARVITAKDVKTIAAELAKIDEKTLRERFNPHEMMKLKIYPDIWDRDPAKDDVLGYCIENVDLLRQFLSTAEARSLGIVICLT